LEKKWLEGSTGLKNDPQGRKVFPLADTPLENSWLRSCLKLNEKQTFQPFFLSQIAAWKTYAIAKR
jgi:hypothetical protein